MALALIAGALAPSCAHAGTLRYRDAFVLPDDCGGTCGGDERLSPALSYHAADAEQNVIRVSVDATTSVVRDVAGVTVDPQATMCVAVDAQTARCAMQLALVDAGDRDDDVVVDGCCTQITGGPGDDRLRGRLVHGAEGDDLITGTGGPAVGALLEGDAGDDVIHGTEWSDLIHPGTGRDQTDAGGGDDEISVRHEYPFETKQFGVLRPIVHAHDPVDTQPDRIDGGAGHDTVSYRYAPQAVTADLTFAKRSEDRLAGVESLSGSRYGDHLSGSGSADVIDGGPREDRGGDVIDGRGGDDRLTIAAGGRLAGGRGADVIRVIGTAGRAALRDHRQTLVDGGAGDDRVSGVTLGTITRCGTGRDVVRTVGGFLPGLLGDDCEAGRGRVRVVSAGGGELRVMRTCPAPTFGIEGCDVTARVLDGHSRVIATSRYHRDRDGGGPSSVVARLHLPAAGRRAGRSGRRPRLRVLVTRRVRVGGGVIVERGSRWWRG